MFYTNKVPRVVPSFMEKTIKWIKDDWASSKVRFVFEFAAWMISIGCAIAMALTAPLPPLYILYPIWITGCLIYAVCAYTRGSFGMLANYLLLVTIDTIGFVRMTFFN